MESTDQHIVEALLRRDPKTTHDFFFVWCRPLLLSLVRKVFGYEVDYDEIVNELYLFLMEDDGRRIRSFQGRSSLYQWLKCVATRFFIEKRDRRQVIENASTEPLYPKEDSSAEAVEMDALMVDIRRLLGMMRNLRYRMVLERILIDDMSYEDLAERMETSVANLYNIKKRAMAEFMAIVLREYGNGKN